MLNDATPAVQSHRCLVVILIAFLALSATYSIVTPIFEAGDELWHYPFVQHLATGHGLPIQDPNVKTLWEQEGGQPPLYYALSAFATFWIDTRDLPDRLWHNPHARIGIPLDYGNKNMIVHTSAEDFPWQNTTLAVHLIRFFSIFLSAITVALTYFFALEIKADKTLAALAAALVAFNPMFLFISASVNNDNLATMLATLALLLLAQLITHGADASSRSAYTSQPTSNLLRGDASQTRRFLILGIVLGLGALTKVSNLGLLGVAACVFVYLAWQEMRQGARLRVSLSPSLLVKCLVCAALVVVIAFWWYTRNWILYGDFSAFNIWVQIAGGRPTPVTFASLINEFQGFRISFWGNFGGVNLIAPEWVYIVLDAFTFLGMIGLFAGLAQRASPRLLWLPAIWLAIISISLVRWTWLTMASQGRLIFPAIAAVAVLLAYGLAQFQVPSFKFQVSGFRFQILPFTFAFFVWTFALLSPFTLIAPAYALPARFPNDATIPNPVHITFNDQAELVGYALPQTRVSPGNELPLTLYWRAREPIPEDFSVYIRLFDANDKIIARWDAFPGGGLYPTRVWQPDEVIEDKYRIPIPFDARAGGGQIEAGLFRRVPLETLTARDPRGNVVMPTIARFKITGQAQSTPQVENAVNYTFGDQITLVGYARQDNLARGSTLSLKLYWRALVPLSEDYTVFVHLVDANGKIIAQQDAQPQHGAYPTSFWDAGEIVVDEYTFVVPRDAPPGDYQIEIGIYRASDGTRLLTRDGDHIVLGSVIVAQ